MTTYFSRKQAKALLTGWLRANNESHNKRWRKDCAAWIRFIEGVTLGIMISNTSKSFENTLRLFKDWKKSAIDLNISKDKLIILYASYLSLFDRVPNFNMNSDTTSATEYANSMQGDLSKIELTDHESHTN